MSCHIIISYHITSKQVMSHESLVMSPIIIAIPITSNHIIISNHIIWILWIMYYHAEPLPSYSIYQNLSGHWNHYHVLSKSVSNRTITITIITSSSSLTWTNAITIIVVLSHVDLVRKKAAVSCKTQSSYKLSERVRDIHK